MFRFHWKHVHVFTYASSGSMNDFFLAGDPPTVSCRLWHISLSSAIFSVLNLLALESSHMFLLPTWTGWRGTFVSRRTAMRKVSRAISDSSASRSSSAISSLASSNGLSSTCFCLCTAAGREKKLVICCAVLHSSGVNKECLFSSFANFISREICTGSTSCSCVKLLH